MGGMIAIVCSNARERFAFASLCQSKAWPFVETDSIRGAKRLFTRVQPNLIIVRHTLRDGYSDELIALVKGEEWRWPTHTVVILSADATSLVEARQIQLGADVVQRDPLRIDVVSAHIERFRQPRAETRRSATPGDGDRVRFAGASVDLLRRTLTRANRSIGITPRESELIRLLLESGEGVTTYEMLYSEILGRSFRGDTSNMRVLLGKLGRSLEAVGLSVRGAVEVIPKSGYRHLARARDVVPS